MAKRTSRPKKITASQANIARALDELGIDKPYYVCRVVGGRLELTLYGGEVVYWPPRRGDPTWSPKED
jgi:hypothetical protein